MMQSYLLKRTSRYCVLFFALVCGLNYGQAIDDIQQLCEDITPEKEALAEQAGYDLDQLCSIPLETDSDVVSRSVPPPTPLEPRETISSNEYKIDSKLRPFGYDLFANQPSTFSPLSNVPVSDGYLLGLGDTLDILFYGTKNDQFSLEINREGFVDFPQLGPIALAGLSFGEAKKKLEARMATQFIGTQASISIGALNSIQIFVLGEAYTPGAYTVSSLSTISNALIAGGGISDIGSLRNVQLKRRGEVIRVLDLYDLLLSGDTENDVRVESADVIYIPTVRSTVSIDGEVMRPAIYELKGGESVEDLILLAGGVSPKAFIRSIKLQRISSDGFKTVYDLDLSNDADKSFKVRSGDHVVVGEITDYNKKIVTLSGAVRHPGMISWNPSLRISDILPDKETLNSGANLDLAILVREIPNTNEIEVLPLNLKNILLDQTSEDNIYLSSRDEIFVLNEYADRAAQLAPYTSKLTRQASFGNLSQIVSVGGAVRFPGDYPLLQNMTLTDLITLSGGLTERAFGQHAEVTRLNLSNPNKANVDILSAEISSSNKFYLVASDSIEFRNVPGFRETQTITLQGEFVFRVDILLSVMKPLLR